VSHAFCRYTLRATDVEDAFELYARIFGWTAVDRMDLGDRQGRHVTFSWGTRRCVGSVADIARLPHVHPQWLFFFRTDTLEESLARVRDLGGLTLPITTTPEGNLVAPCDDPQGAAFALFAVRAATPQSPTTKASSAIRRSC
jgi:predicted enzyme related to lactoylglutathione lyase